PKLNTSTGALLHPTVNADGTLLAFAAWDKAGTGQRWDVLLYDIPGQKSIDAPKLNMPKFDQRMPAMSADGRWLAFVSNRKDSVGLTDIWLYDRKESTVVAMPEL